MLADALSKTSEIKSLKTQLTDAVNELKEAHEKMGVIGKERDSFEGRVNRLEKVIEKLKEELEKYRTVGDIGSLLGRVEELEALVDSQRE